MYSKSRKSAYDNTDAENELLSDEEYELYRYNLPPGYDGNRFRRKSHTDGARNDPRLKASTHDDSLYTDKDVPETDVSGKGDASPTDSLDCMSTLRGKLGYEELLIISLILLISGSGNDSGDIILLLTLILLSK